MLKEFRNVRQEPEAAGRRRWFDDDIQPLEFIVWYDAAGAIEGFQICYDLGRGAHALTWRPVQGFVHNAVDTGSAGPLTNLTPILVPDGRVPWEEIIQRFEGCSATLEPTLRELVNARLNAEN